MPGLFSAAQQRLRLAWQKTYGVCLTGVVVNPAEVTLKKVCVDSRLQWGQARNLWHNAVIRTTLALPARTIQRLLGRSQ